VGIGTRVDKLTSSLLGLLDEVSIYNRALTAFEIQSIVAAGAAGKCAPPQREARVLDHWRFDESGGTSAHDSAGTYDGLLSSSGASFVTDGISGNAISISKAAKGFVS